MAAAPRTTRLVTASKPATSTAPRSGSVFGPACRSSAAEVPGWNMKRSTKSSMRMKLNTKPGTGTIAGRPPTRPVRIVVDTARAGTATAARTIKDRRRLGPAADAPRRDYAAPPSAAGAVDTVRPTALLVWGGRPVTARFDE